MIDLNPRLSTRIVTLMLAFCVVLSGCAEDEGSGGTDIGNPETSVTTHFLGYDSQEQPGGLTLDSGITIDAAWIVVEQIALEDDASCGADPTIDDAGPIVLNLLEGTEFPRTPTFTRPSGPYCELGLKLVALDNADLLPADAPPALVTNSVVITGTTDGLLLDLPFRIEVALDDELVLLPTGDAITLEGDQASFIVGFALELVVTVDLLESVGGVVEIVLDPSSDAALLEELGVSLQNSAQLFLDSNLDGDLDSNETTPIAQ